MGKLGAGFGGPRAAAAAALAAAAAALVAAAAVAVAVVVAVAAVVVGGCVLAAVAGGGGCVWSGVIAVALALAPALAKRELQEVSKKQWVPEWGPMGSVVRCHESVTFFHFPGLNGTVPSFGAAKRSSE